MIDILYQNYTTFLVLGQEVNLISDQTEYGRNTISEMSDNYFYLGDEYPNISAAILVWQEVNDRKLDGEELQQVLIDNQITSSI